MNQTLPSILILFLAGCSSAPTPEEPPEGIRTEVTILRGGFVMFEDERVPLEAFLLEIRDRVRLADEDLTRLPWVYIEVDSSVNDLSGQAMVQRVMDGLRASGVRTISTPDA